MDWIESIKEIQKSNSNNRLVIFVGAGVSQNSNIPSWRSLIHSFATELNYDKCDSCDLKIKSETCPKPDCTERYNFTQEEFLKIPEYYYLNDKSEGKQNYYEFIRRCLHCEANSNSIDDIIFSIMPHHIITTNYDQLLEHSKDINARLYSAIPQDKDMLSKGGQHYLIKMHGDINAPQSIVLKESDYINYEQNYPLISTYIRSLLVDHTFIFVGYSLNDYNLKLIIGWINYFSKSYGAAMRPQNFLLQIGKINTYEELRLKESNINVVNVDSLPETLLEQSKVPDDIKSEQGRFVYAYLKCVADTQLFHKYVSLEDILIEKYQCLKDYCKISYEDLIQVYPLGQIRFYGGELHVKDEKIFNSLNEIFSHRTKRNQIIVDTFQRSGIDKIVCDVNDAELQIPQDGSSEDKLIKLYLDNKYTQLVIDLLGNSTPTEKIFYYHFLQINLDDIDHLLKCGSEKAFQGDYVEVLLHKMRSRLVALTHFNRCETQTKEIERMLSTTPLYYRDATYYVEKLFHEMASNHAKMSEMLQKQELKYDYQNRAIYYGDCFLEIKKLQSFAYDHYFFCLKNYIPICGFSDPKIYFSYYLRAILCSYSPINNSSDDFFGERIEYLESYPLGEVDMDMLIKYTNPMEFSKWINKYRVKKIIVEPQIDVIAKFICFCESFAQIPNWKFKDHLHSFVILLGILGFEEIDCKKLSVAILQLLQTIRKDTPEKLYVIYPAIHLFAKTIMAKTGSNEKAELADILLTPSVYDKVVSEHPYDLGMIIADLAPFVSLTTRDSLQTSISEIKDDSLKCKRIFELRKILPMEEYTSYLSEQIDNMQIGQIFYFVVERIIVYSDAVLEKYLSIISNEVIKRVRNPGVRSYPDRLTTSIEKCILLKLVGYPVNIQAFEPYEEFSDCLSFLLHPEEFDYSKVDISNYMWVNFFRHAEYAEVFRRHKSEILSNELKELFSLDLANTEQQKIVYGVLLNQDELWKYAK